MGPSTSYGFDELALSLGSTSWVTFDELDLGLRSSAGFDELWVRLALGSSTSSGFDELCTVFVLFR